MRLSTPIMRQTAVIRNDPFDGYRISASQDFSPSRWLYQARGSVSVFFLTASLHFEGHFRVNAVACDFLCIHTGAEFLYLKGANIAQRFGGFHDHIVRRFL